MMRGSDVAGGVGKGTAGYHLAGPLFFQYYYYYHCYALQLQGTGPFGWAIVIRDEEQGM